MGDQTKAKLTAEQEEFIQYQIRAGCVKSVAAPENIAEEAIRLVLGDRNDSYGDPSDDYAGTAKVWSGLLINKLKPGVEISAREAILMMVGLKIRREVTKPKRDNRVDGVGYLLCGDWVTTGQKPIVSEAKQN